MVASYQQSGCLQDTIVILIKTHNWKHKQLNANCNIQLIIFTSMKIIFFWLNLSLKGKLVIDHFSGVLRIVTRMNSFNLLFYLSEKRESLHSYKTFHDL